MCLFLNCKNVIMMVYCLCSVKAEAELLGSQQELFIGWHWVLLSVSVQLYLVTKSAIKNFQYFFLFLHLFTSVISGYLSSGQKNQNITEKRLISHNQGKELVVEYPELEGTHKDLWVQLLALHRTTSDSSPMSENIVQTFLEFQLLSPLLRRVCSMLTTLWWVTFS